MASAGRAEKGTIPRLFIVSNRLPVKGEPDGDDIRFSPTAGGLSTGLSSCYRKFRGCWIGWPGAVPRPLQERVQTRLREEYHCLPVFLPEHLIERYYHGFTNRTLWPLFHSFPMYTRYSEAEWQAYVQVNDLFCREVASAARPGDLVWIHDYHLMLLPALLRRREPGLSLGFFLHIPFPHYDIFRLLPWHRQVIDGLLGCDLIGFHTYDYAQAFLGCMKRIRGIDNTIGRIAVEHRVAQVDVFPMGIDYGRYARAPQTRTVKGEMSKIRRLTGGRKLVFSLSRLDYTKGLPQNVEAIGDFFNRYPQWRGRVVMVLVVVPSREKVERYASLKREIDEMVGRINSQYGTMEWVPIRYWYRYLKDAELQALYAMADVAFITPLRDGMNLIAKEYVASRSRDTGVLILSETAGAAKELREALIVNPNDRCGMVEALDQALLMPGEEQVRRTRAMKQLLESHPVTLWADKFLSRLQEVVTFREMLSAKLIRPAERERIRTAFTGARRRLLLLDYDGTLVPFAPEPSLARPPPPVLDLLERLSADPGNHVVLMSGRDHQTLQSWFANLGITLVAEDGGCYRPRGEDRWIADDAPDLGWKQQIRPIMQLFVDRIPNSFIEEKRFSLVWHFRRADEAIGEEAARDLVDILTNLTANMNTSVIPGNRVVEIRSGGIRKDGFYTRHLAGGEFDFTLAMGDFWTDEALFTVLPPGSISVRVGLAVSHAGLTVETPDDALGFLEHLAGIPEGSVPDTGEGTGEDAFRDMGGE